MDTRNSNRLIETYSGYKIAPPLLVKVLDSHQLTKYTLAKIHEILRTSEDNFGFKINSNERINRYLLLSGYQYKGKPLTRGLLKRLDPKQAKLYFKEKYDEPFKLSSKYEYPLETVLRTIVNYNSVKQAAKSLGTNADALINYLDKIHFDKEIFLSEELKQLLSISQFIIEQKNTNISQNNYKKRKEVPQKELEEKNNDEYYKLDNNHQKSMDQTLLNNEISEKAQKKGKNISLESDKMEVIYSRVTNTISTSQFALLSPPEDLPFFILEKLNPEINNPDDFFFNN